MSHRVLIIDDDATFSTVLARAFSRRGYDAVSLTNGEAALRSAREVAPAAAILDLNLGEVSGLGLIRPLLEAAPDCRIILLTGYASIATAVEAIKLGAVQYFAKPVDVDTLVAAIDTVPDQTMPATSGLPADPMSVSRLEWEHIQRVLLDNDGNVSATARALKMHRRTLQRKLAKRPSKA